jgi:hypothetical protein
MTAEKLKSRRAGMRFSADGLVIAILLTREIVIPKASSQVA